MGYRGANEDDESWSISNSSDSWKSKHGHSRASKRIERCSGHHHLRNGLLLGLVLPLITCLTTLIFFRLSNNNSTGTGHTSLNPFVYTEYFYGSPDSGNKKKHGGGLYAVVMATNMDEISAVRSTWGSRVNLLKFFGQKKMLGDSEELRHAADIVILPGDVLPRGISSLTIQNLCEDEDAGLYPWYLFTSQTMYIDIQALQRHLNSIQQNKFVVHQFLKQMKEDCMGPPGFVISGSLLKDICSQEIVCNYRNTISCLRKKVGLTCSTLPEALVHSFKYENESILVKTIEKIKFGRQQALFVGDGLAPRHLYSFHAKLLSEAMTERNKKISDLERIMAETEADMDIVMTIGGPSQTVHSLASEAYFSSSSCDGATRITRDRIHHQNKTLSFIHSYLTASEDLTSPDLEWYKQYQVYTGQNRYKQFNIHGMKLLRNKTHFSVARLETALHLQPQRISHSRSYLLPETVWILLPVSSKQDLQNFSRVWNELKHRQLNMSIKVLLLRVSRADINVNLSSLPSEFQDKSIYNLNGELRQLIPHTSNSHSKWEAYIHGINYINGIYKNHRRNDVIIFFVHPSYSFQMNLLRRCVSLVAAGLDFTPRGRRDVRRARNIGDVNVNVQIGFADELLENEEYIFGLWRRVPSHLRCIGLQHLPQNVTSENINQPSMNELSHLVANDPDLFYNL